MSQTVRINATVWELLKEEAIKRKTKPTRMVDYLVRQALGLEPKWALGIDATDRCVAAAEEIMEEDNVLPSQRGRVLLDSGEEMPSPLCGNLEEIRLWQKKLKQAEEEYDGYNNGVAEEDWELEQRSDYVVDCSNRIEEARTKLRELVLTVEE